MSEQQGPRGVPAAIERAQEFADLNGRQYGVFEHVGIYGRPGGDIPARHELRISSHDLAEDPQWALVALVDPGSSNK